MCVVLWYRSIAGCTGILHWQFGFHVFVQSRERLLQGFVHQSWGNRECYTEHHDQQTRNGFVLKKIITIISYVISKRSR